MRLVTACSSRVRRLWRNGTHTATAPPASASSNAAAGAASGASTWGACFPPPSPAHGATSRPASTPCTSAAGSRHGQHARTQQLPRRSDPATHDPKAAERDRLAAFKDLRTYGPQPLSRGTAPPLLAIALWVACIAELDVIQRPVPFWIAQSVCAGGVVTASAWYAMTRATNRWMNAWLWSRYWQARMRMPRHLLPRQVRDDPGPGIIA